MRIHTEHGSTVAVFSTKLTPPGDTFVGVVKMTLDLRPDGPSTIADEQRPIEGAQLAFDDGLGSTCRYPGDLAPFKPKADVLLVGACHPPHRPATRCTATLEVGDWNKSLAVVGDRLWTRRTEPGAPVIASDPTPFDSMPLRYELAFGGVDHPPNPYGTGLDRETRDERVVWPLPNVERPETPIASPSDRPEPAGLGPLGSTAMQRSRKKGTYDRRWQYRRKPYPPEDRDWGFYNAAPEDQQIDGYLRGDETVTLIHLDPEHPRLTTRLPDIHPRWFVRCVRGPDRREHFYEVELRLDTLYVDTESRQAILLWRGLTRAARDRIADEDVSFFLLETAEGARRTTAEAWALLLRSLQPDAAAPPPPGPSEDGKRKIAALLDDARKILAEHDAPEELRKKVEGLGDPTAFRTALEAYADELMAALPEPPKPPTV